MNGLLYSQLKTVETTNTLRRYSKGQCIVFRSTKGEYGGLSNMAGGYPIRIASHLIYNSEALYQCLKYPNAPSIQQQILLVKSPIFAKKISRKYSAFERADWENIRFKVMKLCIEVKLKYNYERFSNLLLSTGELPIVEFTKEDKVWGAVDKGDYYEGTNALGRLLMELREKVKTNHTNGFAITVPEVENMTFLGIDLRSYFQD
jgi:ribA/ribD-fused uncharacterized protein